MQELYAGAGRAAGPVPGGERFSLSLGANQILFSQRTGRSPAYRPRPATRLAYQSRRRDWSGPVNVANEGRVVGVKVGRTCDRKRCASRTTGGGGGGPFVGAHT